MKATPRALAAPSFTIGLIADTHGVLSPAVLRLFAGVNHIIHAGDVGKRTVLRKLERVAPVTAIAGNADSGRLAASLPALVRGEIGGVRFLVVHKPKAVRRHLPTAKRDGVQLIVTGHLHEPEFYWEDGILNVNPGSATAPEEGDPQPTVAIVSVLPEGLAVSFIPVPRMPQPPAKPHAKAKTAAAKSAAKSAAKQADEKTAAKTKSDGGMPEAEAADREALHTPGVDAESAPSPEAAEAPAAQAATPAETPADAVAGDEAHAAHH